MAREQKEQVQITGSKLGPLETLKKAQIEEHMNKKGNAMGRDAGQQNEPNQNNVEKAKTKKGTGDVRRNNNQEGDSKNMGQERHRQMDQAHFGNFMEQSRSSIAGQHEKEPENSVNSK